MNTRVVLRGGMVVDGVVPEPYRADVLIENGIIRRVATPDASTGRTSINVEDAKQIDCEGRLVMPGLVDAHSHADGAVFDSAAQLALLRQGVTTVLGGQDGVSYAPGNGDYATRYFAAINGPHPSYVGGGVAGLLSTYDGTTPLNVAYAIPAGTVRFEVMGEEDRPASVAEIARMRAEVARGLGEGAVGLSTGLDYTPGMFADAAEISALCEPVAAAGLLYITHMRGGYEENAEAGVLEIAQIARRTGVRAHISHFHTRADEAWRLLTDLERHGLRVSFDAYVYTRGCTILAMKLLPPELNAMPVADAVAILRDATGRARLRREWFPQVARDASLGEEWPSMISIGHVAAPEFDWTHGLTLEQIATRSGVDAVDAALDIMAAAELNVNAIMAVHHQRPVSDLGRLISHPGHIGGSDGIFVGAHPHPRTYGNFASYLGTYVRSEGFWTWAEAVGHLSTHPAELFGLGARGRVLPEHVADLAIVDPDRVVDRSTYEQPTLLAEGIDDVLVAGIPVLRDGKLTGLKSGAGLRSTHGPQAKEKNVTVHQANN